MTIVDPVDPPEPGQRLNAKNLKGSFLILRPTELGEWPAKAAEHDEQGNVVAQAKGPQTYVACDVWVFDRAGVTDHDTGIRFSWWRAVEQLKQQMGQLVACRPVEDADKSVYLRRLDGDARDAAEKVVAEIATVPAPAAATGVEAYSEEPF